MRNIAIASLCLGLNASPAAWSATGQIDSFGASATTVQAGSWVDFFVSYSVSTTSWSNGGSDPYEPAPQEGYQEWFINWYGYEHETLSAVHLEAAGQNFQDNPTVPPGASHSGGWSFSLYFQDAGTFDITLSGGWNAMYEVYSGSEIAQRDCAGDGEGGLTCSSWTYAYPEYSDRYSTDGSFDGRTLTIEVTAVPEPETAALWLAGLGFLALAGMRGRR